MQPVQLDQLLGAVGEAKRLLILPHNNPDSDAIASVVGLRFLLWEKLGVGGIIRYKGLIGRAENKALARYLNYPLKLLKEEDLEQGLPLALIDTQPGRSNNPVPSQTQLAIVLDHHEWFEPQLAGRVKFADVRANLGATSTILTEYLRAAEVTLPQELATALFYGIKSSTMGLGRNTTTADAEAYYYLQPQIDVEVVASIDTARVPPHYFKSFDTMLRAARLYEGLVIAYIGPMLYPDLTAEMADLLLRLEEAEWVVCMWVHDKTFILSVRTRHPEARSGRMVQTVIGPKGTAGGHGTMAGGQIPLGGQDPQQLSAVLTERILQYFHVPAQAGKPLI